jgi:hypothetical protein
MLDRQIQAKRRKRHSMDADLLSKKRAIEHMAAVSQKVLDLEEQAKENLKVAEAEIAALKREERALIDVIPLLRAKGRSTALWRLLSPLKATSLADDVKAKETIPYLEWSVNKGMCFQGCDHPLDHCRECVIACWVACDAATARLAKDGAFVGSLPLPHTRADGVAVTLQRRDFGGTSWCVQRNIETKRERVLSEVRLDWSRPLTDDHIMARRDLEQLLSTGCSVGLSTKLQMLFRNAATCAGECLTSWAIKNGGLEVEARLEPALNRQALESFVLARSHARSQLCLFGFHGTGTTKPEVVVSGGGLDPRCCSTGRLYLGAAAYVCTDPVYPHVNGYMHKSGVSSSSAASGSRTSSGPTEEFVQLLVAFLPGQVYFEEHSNSDEAAKRRKAPEGFDTVACETQGSLVWALYKQEHSCPLFYVRYRFVKPTA